MRVAIILLAAAFAVAFLEGANAIGCGQKPLEARRMKRSVSNEVPRELQDEQKLPIHREAAAPQLHKKTAPVVDNKQEAMIPADRARHYGSWWGGWPSYWDYYPWGYYGGYGWRAEDIASIERGLKGDQM